MTAATLRTRPAEVERRGRQGQTDQVTADVCRVLSRWQCQFSPSRVSRIVHRIARRVTDPWFMADQIAGEFVRSERQRRIVADELRRVIPWADPTGEMAVRNVIRERGF